MLMNARLSPSVGKAPCCPLLHRRNPKAPPLPLPTLENVAYLSHSSNSTSPCCFTPLHCHEKNDKGKNNYKEQDLCPHGRMGFTKPRERTGKAEEEQTPKYFSSFLTHPRHLPAPQGDQRSHGCKPGVPLKMSFNTTVHQCYLLKPKQRRLCLLSSQEQLNHKTKIFRFIMSLPLCACKSPKRCEVENRYIGLL